MDALTADRSADAAEQMELLRPGRPFRFTSPLIRWAVYHDIPTARRSELHADAADLLEAHGADDAVVAEHLLATEPTGDAAPLTACSRSGRRAWPSATVTWPSAASSVPWSNRHPPNGTPRSTSTWPPPKSPTGEHRPWPTSARPSNGRTSTPAARCGSAWTSSATWATTRLCGPRPSPC